MAVVQMKKSKPDKALTKPYEPNSREQEVVKSWETRKAKRTPAPLFKTEMSPGIDGVPNANLSIVHADPLTGYALQSEAIGSTSFAYYDGVLRSLAILATKDGKTNDTNLNFAFSLVAGIEPRDQLESMLAVQMAAIHMATMTQAHRLRAADTLEGIESHERTFNKLARTFAAQVEALKRYRSKGEQRVIVERVTVNEGGQAIVGNVAHGEG